MHQQDSAAHLGAACLHLGHHAGVVALVAGDQVRALQHQADDGRVALERHVLARVVPVQVLLHVLVHACMNMKPSVKHLAVSMRSLCNEPQQHGSGKDSLVACMARS